MQLRKAFEQAVASVEKTQEATGKDKEEMQLATVLICVVFFTCIMCCFYEWRSFFVFRLQYVYVC